MITSPIRHDPDSDRAKLERGIAQLEITKNAYASVVCFSVTRNLGDRPQIKSYARISLAAEKGIHNLLHKQIEGG